MKSCGRVLVLGTAFPEILKTSAELAATQGDDGVGAVHSPVHARSLEPSADHYFTASLYDAGRGT